MKRAIFLSSFFSTHFRGSKLRTSPAMRQSKAVASKCVTGPMPLLPASKLRQTSSVPIPQPQINPTPVTTTRRFTGKSPVSEWGPAELLRCLGVLFDVLDGVFDRGNLLCVFIRNLDSK